MRELIDALGDVPAILAEADTATKAQLYAALGLRSTYQPHQDRVLVEAEPWGFDRVRGVSGPVAHHRGFRFEIAL